MRANDPRNALRLHSRRALKALLGRRIWTKLRAARIESHPTERELKPAIAIVRRLASGVTIDVGANNGMYAIPLAGAGARVVAFEANPVLCEWLRSELPNSVTVENFALADGEGRVTLRIPIIAGREIPGMATIAEANSFESFESFEVERTRHLEVPAISLDKYAADRLRNQAITFVKVDVEGAEGSVLKGARTILQRDHPVLLVETEIRHGADLAAIFADLAQMDYRPYILADFGDRLVATSIDEVPRLQAAGNAPQPGRAASPHYINNFFFIPTSRLPALFGLIST
jgi:FkbM family methyltransferase